MGGFFDSYKEIGGNFIGAAEKQVLIENGIPMSISSLVHDENNKFGPRFVATVTLPDPATGEDTERAISFPIGTVDSRDRMLGEMEKYLDGEDADEVRIKLEKVGRSILVRPA